jgi:hypothetical protein
MLTQRVDLWSKGLKVEASVISKAIETKHQKYLTFIFNSKTKNPHKKLYWTKPEKKKL